MQSYGALSVPQRAVMAKRLFQASLCIPSCWLYHIVAYTGELEIENTRAATMADLAKRRENFLRRGTVTDSFRTALGLSLVMTFVHSL